MKTHQKNNRKFGSKISLIKDSALVLLSFSMAILLTHAYVFDKEIFKTLFSSVLIVCALIVLKTNSINPKKI